MLHVRPAIGLALFLMLVLSYPSINRAEDIDEVASSERTAGKDDNKRYFLIGPHEDDEAPEEGFGLIIVMPGGDGSEEFHPFVKRIFLHSVPRGYLAAQPVAVQWSPNQPIVWPTAKNRVPRMKFTTEEFVDAVIDDVAGKHKLDPRRTFTLSWSSSGPAAYATSLTSKKVTGSFIAMSVFVPKFQPPLSAANGRAYYLYHSPADNICPFRMAQQAEKELAREGAEVELTTYDGGHGWRSRNLYGDIREGVEWLEEQTDDE